MSRKLLPKENSNRRFVVSVQSVQLIKNALNNSEKALDRLFNFQSTYHKEDTEMNNLMKEIDEIVKDCPSNAKFFFKREKLPFKRIKIKQSYKDLSRADTETSSKSGTKSLSQLKYIDHRWNGRRSLCITPVLGRRTRMSSKKLK